MSWDTVLDKLEVREVLMRLSFVKIASVDRHLPVPPKQPR